MNKFKSIGFFLFTVFISNISHALPELLVNAHSNSILIDMSGSMRGKRWEIAKERVEHHLATIRERSINIGKPQWISITTFKNQLKSFPIQQEILPMEERDLSDPDQKDIVFDAVKAIFDTSNQPSGATPLVGSACDAIINSIQNASNRDLATNHYVYVISDGNENSTPESHICGPTVNFDESIHDWNNPPIGTWPRILRSVAWYGFTFTGNDITGVNQEHTNEPPPLFNEENSGSVVWNHDHIFDDVDTLVSNDNIPQPLKTRFYKSVANIFDSISFFLIPEVHASSPQKNANTFEDFYRIVAEGTSGRYNAIRALPDGSNYFIDPSTSSLQGDIDRDGCVGRVDLDKMFQSDTWMQKVKSNKQHTYFADINQDYIIDIDDYYILLSNYGKGNCVADELK